MKTRIQKYGFVSGLLLILMLMTACGQNSTDKQAHVHTWVEATCTSPKTCSECGATEGNAKGHSVQIGKCANCGEPQGKDIVDSIKAKLKIASSSHDRAIETAQTGASMGSFDVLESSLDEYKKVKDAYQEAYDLCGNYGELSDLKTKLDKAINSVPTQIAGSDSASLQQFVNEMTDLANASLEVDLAGAAAEKLFE